MPGSQSFSRRFGHNQEPPITITNDAPEEFRVAMIDAAAMLPSQMRQIVCRVLRKIPDKSNWSEYPNIEGEVQYLVMGAPWYKIYDIAEEVYKSLGEAGVKKKFEDDLNDVMRDLGIGWAMKNGVLERRGTDSFEKVIGDSLETLASAGYTIAENELNEARQDLSKRPKPDLSGAVHHSMAALESVARDHFKDPKKTLGELIKAHRDSWPKPMDKALENMWGFASEQARHGREGQDLKIEDVTLLVGVSAAMADYFAKKRTNKSAW